MIGNGLSKMYKVFLDATSVSSSIKAHLARWAVPNHHGRHGVCISTSTLNVMLLNASEWGVCWPHWCSWALGWQCLLWSVFVMLAFLHALSFTHPFPGDGCNPCSISRVRHHQDAGYPSPWGKTIFQPVARCGSYSRWYVWCWCSTQHDLPWGRDSECLPCSFCTPQEYESSSKCQSGTSVSHQSSHWTVFTFKVSSKRPTPSSHSKPPHYGSFPFSTPLVNPAQFSLSPQYIVSAASSAPICQAPVSGQCAASSTPSFSAVSPVLPPAPSSPHMPSSICSPQFMHRQVPDPLTPYVVTCAEGWGVCVLPLIAQVPGCDQARSSHDLILPPPDAFLAPNTLLPIAYPPFALTTVHGTMFSHWFNSCLFYGLVMHQKIWVSILISPHCGRNGRRAQQLRVWAAHHHWDSLMSGGETVEGSEQVEDGTLSFAMDAWTSPNHKVYMAVTVHFESNGTPVKMLLNLVEVVCTQVWTLQLHLWQSWMTLILWIRWALNNNPLRNSSPGPRYSVSQAIMIWWLMNLKDWLIVFRSSKLDALFCTSYQSHFKDAIWCT